MSASRQPLGISPAARERVRACLAARAGLEVPEWVLDARVRERIAALGTQIPDARDPGEAYAELLSSPGGAAELDRLIESVRVGETRFFRHRAHVRALANEVVPALRDRIRPGQPVRAWSAGCATGEEAYTLAMILGRLLPGREVRVLATDLSQSALEIARQGIYPAAALAPVPERWRRYGFVAEPEAGSNRWRLAPEVRRRVKIQRHNLLDRDYPGGFDLIWCRNVLIYLAPEARRQVVARLTRSLNGGGYLFVGYAESLRDTADLEPVRTAEAVLYRNPGRKPGRKTGREAVPERQPRIQPRAARMPARPEPRPEPQAAPRPAPEGMIEPGISVVRLSGRYEDEHRLAAELRAAMAGSHAQVVIELDGASFLADVTAAVLRRAQSAARAGGAAVHLRADRAGTRRWLRRHGLRLDTPSPVPLEVPDDVPGDSPGDAPGRRPGRGLGKQP